MDNCRNWRERAYMRTVGHPAEMASESANAATDLQQVINNAEISINYEPKDSAKSIVLPDWMRFGENWKWEDSIECADLDRDDFNENYFYSMDPDKLIYLYRHMENFMMARGVSMTFMRNYVQMSNASQKQDEESFGE